MILTKIIASFLGPKLGLLHYWQYEAQNVAISRL